MLFCSWYNGEIFCLNIFNHPYLKLSCCLLSCQLSFILPEPVLLLRTSFGQTFHFKMNFLFSFYGFFNLVVNYAGLLSDFFRPDVFILSGPQLSLNNFRMFWRDLILIIVPFNCLLIMFLQSLSFEIKGDCFGLKEQASINIKVYLSSIGITAPYQWNIISDFLQISSPGHIQLWPPAPMCRCLGYLETLFLLYDYRIHLPTQCEGSWRHFPVRLPHGFDHRVVVHPHLSNTSGPDISSSDSVREFISLMLSNLFDSLLSLISRSVLSPVYPCLSRPYSL